MKKMFKSILSLALILIVSGYVSAQSLPLMPADPAVSAGVLPNGMSYYIVENSTSKGLADFALIQKTGTDTPEPELSERPVTVAKDVLASLPRLRPDSPQTFFSRHGVAPGKDGFVKVSPNATVYRFSNVAVSAGSSLVDSSLLVLLNMADQGTDSSDEFLSRWYVPSDQAIVISGDVKAAELAEKLRLMSMMTPAGKSAERKEYVWNDRLEPSFEASPCLTKDVAVVTATWMSPRTPKEYMNTVQPAIYEMFVGELGTLAQERLEQRMKKDGIPVADVSYRHVSSAASLGDESFSISIAVAPEHVAQAVEALAQVMSSLESGHASADELEMAKRRYVIAVRERSEVALKSNAEYVDRCATAFLYNAPLSSEREILAFLRSRDLDINTELSLFNDIASALMDSSRNLSVTCHTGEGCDMDSARLQELFTSAWGKGTDEVCCAQIDSLPFPGPGLKIKLKTSKTEPLSGGSVWTFENGFRVIYKQMDTDRRLYYSLALNGGYGNIRSLSKGEGAYFSDYLGLCSVSGLSGDEFRQVLEAEDMTMDAQVNISNTIISGSLPDRKPELLMRTLLAVANERKHDSEAFDYYKKCVDISHEYSKGSITDRITAIDSLMCPDYIYSPMKTPGRMTDRYPRKADAFYEIQFEKMNDGVLVLVGNIDEFKLRKMLLTYVGEFRTEGRPFSGTKVQYQPIAGTATCQVNGDSNSMDVTMSVQLPLTAENYMASALAAEVLKCRISESMNGTGTYLRLSHNCRIYPNERFNVMLSVAEASADGFATGMDVMEFDEVVNRLRSVIAGLGSVEISAEELSAYKDVLKGELAVRSKEPEYWTHALVMRYLDGKDLTSGYEAKIDSVSPAKVRSILASLAGASMVEYIITK